MTMRELKVNKTVLLEAHPIKVYSQRRLIKYHQKLKVFHFDGDSVILQSLLKSLPEDVANKYENSYIRIAGTQDQPLNQCCFSCAFICPCCFQSIDCLKIFRVTSFSIRNELYKDLAVILKSPNIKNMILIVKDNAFNREKAAILSSLLKESAIREFTFINQAGEYDYLEREFTQFSSYMKPIKLLNNKTTELKWGKKTVLKK